jgi:queuine tRNA-ribosyltransferase
VQAASVKRTIAWAKRCRDEFVARVGAEAGAAPGDRPLLFAVVQGGNDDELRRRCADELAAMGFDGFGFGGWPVAEGGGLTDMVARVAELLPAEAPKHALGIGKPDNIVAAWRAGYRLFDCAIPTRDARRRRLYVSSENGSNRLSNNNIFSFLYVEDERYARDDSAIDPAMENSGPSRAYLHHLFKIKDAAAERLATKHNLMFYARLIDRLRAAS